MAYSSRLLIKLDDCLDNRFQVGFKNEKHPGAQSIITTGKHVFALRAFSGKLEDKHKEAFYNMGSLCEEGFEAINSMKSILVDSKFKLNF